MDEVDDIDKSGFRPQSFSWDANAKKNYKQKGSLLWTDKFGKTIAAAFLPRN